MFDLGGVGVNIGSANGLAFDNFVIVKSVDNFPDPILGKITLENNFTYWINGTVDIGTNEIILPAKCTIKGFSTFESILTSDTTGTLLTGSAIDNLQLDNVGIECPNGTLYELTGGGAGVVFMDFVISFTSVTVGTITDVFSTVMKAGWFSFTNGLTMAGTSIFLTMNESVFSGFTGIGLDLGTSVITNPKFSNCTWTGTGGSSTDISGLVSSGNIPTGGEAIVTGCAFSTTGTILNNIISSDLQWSFINNRGVVDSTVSAEAQVIGNVTTTVIHAQNARVIMDVTGVIGTEISRMTVATDGVSTYNGIEDQSIALDGNILLEPASSTRQIACQFAAITAAQTVVTFTNGTNLINDTATPLVNGDQITFKDTAGTLPAELFDDVIYFVVNQLTNSFQVEYKPGDGVITFTDDGSGTNSYKICDLHGSIPSLPIAANSPRNLVPQALHTLITDEETTIVVINEDSAVDIEITDAYYRMKI